MWTRVRSTSQRSLQCSCLSVKRCRLRPDSKTPPSDIINTSVARPKVIEAQNLCLLVYQVARTAYSQSHGGRGKSKSDPSHCAVIAVPMMNQYLTHTRENLSSKESMCYCRHSSASRLVRLTVLFDHRTRSTAGRDHPRRDPTPFFSSHPAVHQAHSPPAAPHRLDHCTSLSGIFSIMERSLSSATTSRESSGQCLLNTSAAC